MFQIEGVEKLEAHILCSVITLSRVISTVQAKLLLYAHNKALHIIHTNHLQFRMIRTKKGDYSPVNQYTIGPPSHCVLCGTGVPR